MISQKVNLDSYDSKIYLENAKNNNPVNRGKSIAIRPKYREQYDLDANKYTNSKYFKNYSTLGTNKNDDFKMTDHVKLYDPKSFSSTLMKFKIKRDVSPKVGQNDKSGSYSPLRDQYLKRIQCINN